MSTRVLTALLLVALTGCLYEHRCVNGYVRVDGRCVLPMEDSGPWDAGIDSATDAMDGGADASSPPDAAPDAATCPSECGWGCVGGSCDTVTAVEAGFTSTCALMDSGRVFCWGDNRLGQLGDGTTTGRPRPSLPVVDLEDAFILSGEAAHVCAAKEGGGLVCWGMNERGQLGDPSLENHPSPIAIDLPFPLVDVAAGFTVTCAVEGTTTRCWGENDAGQLGDGTDVTRFEPAPTAELVGVDELAAGDKHVCARVFDGTLYCWGENDDGQLGDGSTTERHVPTRVGTLDDVTRIAAGFQHTCAIRAGGQLLCWGKNDAGQIGDGTSAGTGVAHQPTPTPVSGIADAIDVAAGRAHTCAIRAGGRVQCWGDNSSGQLGNGTTTPSALPVDVSGLTDAVQISSGISDHTCAVRSTGEVVCWGSNTSGQIGDGTSGVDEHRSTPTAVLVPMD